MYSLAAVRKKSFIGKLKPLLSVQNFNHSTAGFEHPSQEFADIDPGKMEFSKSWEFDSKKFGINNLRVPDSPWRVMKKIRDLGFEAYLVGGCVRDLLLNRIPKDFDVITTATLREIKRKLRNPYHCMIIGRRFPICHVTFKGCTVEVSSFDTAAELQKGKEKFPVYQLQKGYGEKDITRWRDCMRRDFTVNSLFYDPFTNTIYDYANALSDIRLSKLRTLIPAQLSFEEDSARILRGLRLAARLDLSFSKETEIAMHKLSSSILSLPKSRILMEVNYMLSYGAAERSLSLLHNFHLLEILLPVQASYLTEQSQKKSDQIPFMMKLFSNLDRMVSCDRPAHMNMWVAMLAFHLALVSEPQKALVVLTFGSVLYHGNWKEGFTFARGHAQEVHSYTPEISNYSDSLSDDELAEKVTKLAIKVQNSSRILTDADSLLKEMKKVPEYPGPGLVFVTKKCMDSVAQIFQVLVTEVTDVRTKKGSLDGRDLRELRFALGKIIVRTMGIRTSFHGVDRQQKRSYESAGNSHDVDMISGASLNKKLRTAYHMERPVIEKKHGLSPKENSFSQKGRTQNQNAAAKKHRNVSSGGIGRVVQDYASNKMQKRRDGFEGFKNEILASVSKAAGDKEEWKGSGQKHLKLEEGELHGDVSKKQQKSAQGKSHLQQHSFSEKKKDVVEDHTQGNRQQQEKGAAKPEKTQTKGGLSRLSSIFK